MNVNDAIKYLRSLMEVQKAMSEDGEIKAIQVTHDAIETIIHRNKELEFENGSLHLERIALGKVKGGAYE